MISLSSWVLFLTNASLAALSVYWTVTAWAAFQAAKAEQPWLMTNCTVVSKSATNRSIDYCPVLTVANFTTPPPEPTQAYRYGYPIYNETEASAQQFLSKYAINDTYACWLSSPPDVRVALTFIPYGPRPNDVNVAAISTVLSLAAVTSFAAVAYLLLLTSRTIHVEVAVTSLPATAVREGLSLDEINIVIEMARKKDVKHLTSSDESCAICLEPGLGATLSCNHSFHANCIRSWLLKGGDKCPLCCAQIRPPISSSRIAFSTDPNFHCGPIENSNPPIQSRVQPHVVNFVRGVPLDVLRRRGRHSAPTNLRHVSVDDNNNFDENIVHHYPSGQAQQNPHFGTDQLMCPTSSSGTAPALRANLSVPLLRNERPHNANGMVIAMTVMATDTFDDSEDDLEFAHLGRHNNLVD